jgi:hypothetical protein
MMCGILIIAFPITIIGANFADVWEEAKREKTKKAIARVLEQEKVELPPIDEVMDLLQAQNEVREYLSLPQCRLRAGLFLFSFRSLSLFHCLRARCWLMP